ncbi:MAG TPA: hypothetical protein DD438_10505 [Verrucomicrobiales bacterium]|nr:hypothetical protein [Roseibacillus sp.]HBM78531.1 hypothetical protein [Verrucomicrobiales bacterium]
MTRSISRPGRNARRIFVVLILLACGCYPLFGPKLWKRIQTPRQVQGEALRASPVYSAEHPMMGTTAQIVVYATDPRKGEAAITAAFQRADEIGLICSDYNPKSELMRLCKGPVNEPIEVSRTLATVLTHARSIAETTEGAFDPTLGGFTKLWRRSKRQKALPDTALLEKARKAAGWEKFEVSLEEKTVTLKGENLLFDLGGIAKGYAADEMLRIIKSHGISSAMVAVAGDIRLGSSPPDRAGWAVGIRTLGADIEQIIHVSNCAVSTSGDIERYVEIEGTRYSHIIDPGTGIGLTRRIAATVVAPTAVQSDPLATFCCIRPQFAAQVFAAGEISCRIVTLGNGPFDQRTRQFPPLTRP